ncbi:hypothetical protein B9G49_01165 [Halorubrum sp. SD683]|nr:hypothetical protein B9G49_01165 [Halorubrum sp. SD683]
MFLGISIEGSIVEEMQYVVEKVAVSVHDIHEGVPHFRIGELILGPHYAEPSENSTRVDFFVGSDRVP